MPADPSVRPSSPSPSWPALDLLKCAGIAGMILAHIVTYFMTWGGEVQVPENSPIMSLVHGGMVIGFFPLLLPITAGCSFFLGFFRELPVGRLSGTQLLRPLVTGLVIIGLGYVFNLIELGWHYRSMWQILQFIGLSLIVLALLAWRLPIGAIPVAGMLALIATPWLRENFGNSYDIDRQILFETIRQGNSWPLIPWFPLVAFGFTIAWVRDGAQGTRYFRPALWVTAVVLIGWAWCRGRLLPPLDPASLSGNKMFNPSPDFVVGVMGLASLAFALGESIGDRITLTRYGIVNVFSKGILWIYLIHLAVLHHFYLWLIGRFDMRDYALHLTDWSNLAGIAAIWAVLLAVSYIVGYAAIRVLQDSRIRIRLRRRRA